MRLTSALKFKEDFTRRVAPFETIRDQYLIDDAARLEDSLLDLLEGIWPLLEGKRPFIRAWYHEAVAEHLEATYYGNILWLLINQPPRTSKSTMLIAFFIWCWIKDPSLQFLFLSYGLRLSTRDSVRCRRILDSKWFKDRWGHKVRLSSDVNTKLRFDNTSTGYRIVTAINSTGTGDGGDFLVFDDINNAGDVNSQTIRDGTNEWVDNVTPTRLNNLDTSRIIAVQQRLHSQDHSGHVLAQNIPNLVHLCIPMEFEISRQCVTVPLKSTNGKPWKDPRKNEGEVICPTRFNPKALARLKAELKSEYRIAGQLQQRPAPAEGGIIKKTWWSWWKEPNPPRCDFILQSWDTAFSTNAKSSYSACTTWGVFKDKHAVSQVILLDTWRGRVEYPDLRRMALRLAHNYHDTHIDHPTPEDYILRPTMILIEAKATGDPLIKDLTRAGLIINKFDPMKDGGGDKERRVSLVTNIIEAGRVWMPSHPPHYDILRTYADIFVEDCAVFPNGESNDFVDSMSQALIKLQAMGWIGHPDDAVISKMYNRWEGERFY